MYFVMLAKKDSTGQICRTWSDKQYGTYQVEREYNVERVAITSDWRGVVDCKITEHEKLEGEARDEQSTIDFIERDIKRTIQAVFKC